MATITATLIPPNKHIVERGLMAKAGLRGEPERIPIANLDPLFLVLFGRRKNYVCDIRAIMQEGFLASFFFFEQQ